MCGCTCVCVCVCVTAGVVGVIVLARASHAGDRGSIPADSLLVQNGLLTDLLKSGVRGRVVINL